jgi:hypothetical protein
VAAIERSYPVTGITCRVMAPAGATVTLEPEGRSLPAQRDGAYVRFEIPALDIMAIAKIAPPHSYRPRPAQGC